jgi:hypothetical protein
MPAWESTDERGMNGAGLQPTQSGIAPTAFRIWFSHKLVFAQGPTA